MPRYPIYIISKGRWETRLTARALEALKCTYRIVIEPQEYDQYAAVIDRDKIFTLPFSNLGQGSIPARNWVWEHSIAEGHRRHWILDDNIRGFVRWDGKKRRHVDNERCFSDCEDFTDRYSNVAISGMAYHFACGKIPNPLANAGAPFEVNTRIYSCILLSNRINYRWRGRYNEDTDLSLRVLKDGWCTILFLAYLCMKQATMTMKGGNTDQLYQQNAAFDGRLEMARSLQKQHPDVTQIVRKWGRWQHHVDYRPFKKNRLIRAVESGATPTPVLHSSDGAS